MKMDTTKDYFANAAMMGTTSVPAVSAFNENYDGVTSEPVGSFIAPVLDMLVP